MRMSCPSCGAEFTIDVLIAHEGAREALVEAMGMNLALGKRIVQYLSLFRPPQRQLTMDRVANILKELSPCIKAAQIERNGRAWAAPMDTWIWAIDEMIAKKDRLNLPLKSHGYLFEIIASAADKNEAAKEKKTEDRRASGAMPSGQSVVVRSEPKPIAEAIRTQMPESVRAQLGLKPRKTPGSEE